MLPRDVNIFSRLFSGSFSTPRLEGPQASREIYLNIEEEKNLAIPNAGRGRKGSRGERKDVWSGDISIWIGLFFFGLPPKRLLLQYEPNLK